MSKVVPVSVKFACVLSNHFPACLLLIQDTQSVLKIGSKYHATNISQTSTDSLIA